ncbi:ABC transporter substrate-binding protein [Plastoroseomonas hellenica]|uniref:ABC transporter substrate-binding protein n=1 Tax=Plastoroseomonas hellenica TaxID=2687306 RepID=UPI001BABE15B|nr:ABC transporter substrate-binding protein [Plastoroseomonas hellenica]MBR0646070.1 ABC transporter substrate-binding protein [Plastoroseomonas hellenica]
MPENRNLPLSRRAAAGLALASFALPRFAIAQADQRPTITVAVQAISTSNTLEPLREQSNVMTRVVSSFLEPLIDLDWLGDLSARPTLAKSWRRIDDRTLELTLRDGVRFHDGSLLTAEDVAFSFGPEHMWGSGGGATPGPGGMFTSMTAGTGTKEPPAEVVAIARLAFPGFDRMEVVDISTVRLVNRTPDVTLEGRLARPAASVISRRAFEAAPDWLSWARQPVGTGPYRVAEYRADSHLLLEAHDAHWAGRPPLRAIRFVQVPEVAARVAGLRTGEYDFACDLPPDQITVVNASPRHHVASRAIANHRVTAFDKTHPTLRDPRIRRALTHAIDRQAIVDGLWSGTSGVPKGMQFDFFGPMLVPDWDAPRFDLAEARRLLREAGYAGAPIPYRLLNNYYTNQTATAQVLVEGWRQAGLNVRIEMKENWSQILLADGGRGLRDNSNTAFFNDPVGAMAAFGPSGQQWASGEWRNDEAAAALEALQSSTDTDRRRAALRRMLEICEREDPAYTVLHQTVNLTGKRRDIGWRASGSFAMDFTARNWSV